jgi:hypothetical protein
MFGPIRFDDEIPPDRNAEIDALRAKIEALQPKIEALLAARARKAAE